MISYPSRKHAEALYEYCNYRMERNKDISDSCISCPLHLFCSQARALDYTTLRDLMGMLLYNILVLEKAEEEEWRQKREQNEKELAEEYKALARVWIESTAKKLWPVEEKEAAK